MNQDLLNMCRYLGSGKKLKDQASYRALSELLECTYDINWEKMETVYHLTEFGFDVTISLKSGEEKSLLQAFIDKCKELYPEEVVE